MSDNAQYDDYAAEAVRRYDEFRSWAIHHWPRADDPISSADFSAGKRELAELLGARLDGGGKPKPAASEAGGNSGTEASEQYLPVTPAPWP